MYSFNIFYVMQYLIFILHYLTIIRKNPTHSIENVK